MRLPNLVIICLSFLLIRHSVVLPILEYTGVESSISGASYLLLIIATILLAAAGYIINDYFDIDIDAHNKPGKNKIGLVISKNTAIVTYVILNVAAFALIWHFGNTQGIKYPLLIFILSAGLLYFYSSHYKKMLLTGNIAIAVLSSLTILLPVLFDHAAWSSPPVKLLVFAYAAFAFIMTLIREIIKDCEDVKGDATYGAITLPVFAGINTTRIIVACLCVLVAGAILYIQVLQTQWQNLISFAYTVLLIQLPLIVLASRNVIAKSKENDKWNSRLSKIIMVTGIISMLVFQLSSQ